MTIFTPGGYLQLEEEATVLDCAYRIHSELFFYCNGAIVNDKYVPISHPLKNLDHVKILKDPKVKPKVNWMSILKIRSAQKALGKILRKMERTEDLEKGKAIILNYIKETSVKLKKPNTTITKMIKRQLNCFDFDELCRGIARGKYDLNKINLMITKKGD